MFAVIEIPDFPLKALLRFHPALRGEPVGILKGDGRRAIISHLSPSVHGAEPGMTAAQALSECPAIQLMSPSPLAEREAASLLLSSSWSLSPRVELTAPDRCTVDLSGAPRDKVPAQLRLLRDHLLFEELPVRVGIGSNPLIARYAAHLAQPELWVEDSRLFLEPLPISLLELSADEQQLFRSLGLKTLGALTKFPRASLADRLGSRGDDLWARAAGEWRGTIEAAPFPVRFFADMELEEPVEILDPLLFIIRRFCDRLASEVGQFGGGTSKLSLVLRLDDEKTSSRDFDLPEPTAKPDLLFAVIENHLSSLRTDSPIVGLSLEAFPARRVEQQDGLFDTGLRDAPMFFATLGRIAAVVGSEHVGTPRHRDSHRPDAIDLVPPANSVPERAKPAAPDPHGVLLRRLRPPMPATVELIEARPSFLISRLAHGAVTVLRPAFRQNGEWWTANPFAREEWDVQIGPGLYRLLHVPQGWFIEGIYD